MFEDIIGNPKVKELKDDLDPDVCPYCSSLDIDDISGVFVSSTVYVQLMQCNTCKREWTIHYDQDLNVIGIDS